MNLASFLAFTPLLEKASARRLESASTSWPARLILPFPSSFLSALLKSVAAVVSAALSALPTLPLRPLRFVASALAASRASLAACLAASRASLASCLAAFLESTAELLLVLVLLFELLFEEPARAL